MRDSRLKIASVLAATVVLTCAFSPLAGAQEWSGSVEGSTVSGPTIEQYLKETPDAKLIPHGQLKIDGKSLNCGKRPTVLNSNFDSWGGAFPGFVILNTKKIEGLTTAVKLYVYSHECGHQWEGPDEIKADLFAIRRGVTRGWLDAVGMEDICTFISTLKGDSVHPPGPQRCEVMRKYYNSLVQSGAGQAAAAPPPPAAKPKTKANTLAPE
jgi:hypothetical protein